MLIVKCSHLFLLIVAVSSVSSSVLRTNEHDHKSTTAEKATILNEQSKNVELVDENKEVTKTTQIPTGINTLIVDETIVKSEAKNKDDSPPETKVEKTKFTPPKSYAASDIQIPVDVIYDTTVTPTKHVGHKMRVGRYRKIRRLKHARNFQSRVDESLEKRNEVTTLRSQSIHSKNDISTDASKPSTEKAQKRVRDPVVPIIESENHVYAHSGNFNYRYTSGDGTVAFENGEFKKTGAEDKPKKSVEGGFSYTDKDGNDFSITYTAGENGYVPSGAHLPTPPPIPPAIARALKYLATKPTEEPVTYSYIDYV